MKKSNSPNLINFPNAPFFRRFAALVYDSFIVFSFLLLATTIALIVNKGASLQPYRWLFLAYLFISTGLFLSWFWKTSGQTLGMLAWKIRVVNGEGTALTWRQAFCRYLLSFVTILCGGLGFLWCLIDKEKQSLHDRMLHFKMIKYQQ